MRGMGPVRCVGLTVKKGEWPEVTGEYNAVTDSGYDEEGTADEGAHAEVVEIEDEAGEAEEVVPGASVEGYWPDDDTWLPAVVDSIFEDGSIRIVWEDSSQ